jgi:hypothetical protein
MDLLEARKIHCPYCNELIEVVIDCSVTDEQQYIEDCFVCCQPIDVSVSIDSSGEVRLVARNENEG